MSTTDKTIPTLDEMIFPGRTNQNETATPETAHVEPEVKSAPESEPAKKEAAAASAKSSSKRNSFETMVNRQVDAILARHMKAARAEIVRAVMIELRSRLPVTNRKD